MKSSNRALAIYAAVLVGLMLFAMVYNSPLIRREDKSITYPQFLSMVEKHEVSAVAISDYTLYGLKKDTSISQSLFPSKNYDFETTIGEDFLYTARQMRAREMGTELDSVSITDLDFTLTYVRQPNRWWVSVLPFAVEILFIVALWAIYLRPRNAQGGRGKPFGDVNARLGMNQVNVRVQDPKKNRVTFADVAGSEEEKAELAEMVDFLRDPKQYTRLGARIPKGVLLVGPPGTGKTLLAKAVAGEANVPFFSISGSDFVEMFVGVGASRVRSLFDQAKRAAPSIIFIDEIDAVGRHRGAGLGGGHDEREQTLNQLLVEMDGFTANNGVIVMAATNRRDILDPALLRPGRFDRLVTVNYPDLEGRVAILKVHSRGKPLGDDVDLYNIAKRMPYGTGADLENVLNEAAILAARARAEKISHQMMVDAIAQVQMGPEKRSHKVSEEERRAVAVHESGHAVIGHFLPGCDEVHLVTIVPRGKSAGHTLSLPQQERDNMSRTQIMSYITMAMGGHAAEEMLLGEQYTGASQDLKTATEMCRQMVTKFGMSEAIGPVYLGQDQEVFVGMEFGQNRPYSESLAAQIDAEVRNILEACYEKAKEILDVHRDAMDRLIDVLLREDTVGRQMFVAIMEGREITPDMDEDRPHAAPPIPQVSKEEKESQKMGEEKPSLPSDFLPGEI